MSLNILYRYTLSYEGLLGLYYWAKVIACFSQNWMKKEVLCCCTEYKIRIMSNRNGWDLSLHMWLFSYESTTWKWVTGVLRVLIDIRDDPAVEVEMKVLQPVFSLPQRNQP